MKSVNTILLAEDDPRDVELALAGFATSNLAAEIVVVRDGAEALDYLFRRGDHAARLPGAPAVALIDLKMPKLGGLQVLEAVRADKELRFLPVVILTSSSEESDLAASYQLGANAFVVKPIDFDNFVATVRQIGIFWVGLNEPPLAPRPDSKDSST